MPNKNSGVSYTIAQADLLTPIKVYQRLLKMHIWPVAISEYRNGHFVSPTVNELNPFRKRNNAAEALTFCGYLLPTIAEMISIAELRDNDVVCGRSTVTHTHIGNKIFRSLIQEYGFLYQSTPLRSVKKSTTMEVINAIERSDGRFLKVADKTSENNPETFEVADPVFIYEKCSHALRSYRPTRSLKQASKTKQTREPKNRPNQPTTRITTSTTQPSTTSFDSLYENQQMIFRSLQAEGGFNESSGVVTLNDEDEYDDDQSVASDLTDEWVDQQCIVDEPPRQSLDNSMNTSDTTVITSDEESVFSLTAMDLSPFDLEEFDLDDTARFFEDFLHIEEV